MDPKRGILLELDFSDDELVVRQHPDGMFTIDMALGRLVLNEQQFFQVLEGFIEVASKVLPTRDYGRLDGKTDEQVGP